MSALTDLSESVGSTDIGSEFDAVYVCVDRVSSYRPVLSVTGGAGAEPAVTFFRFHDDGLLLVAAVGLSGRDPAGCWDAIAAWFHRDETRRHGHRGRDVQVLATLYESGPSGISFVERTVYEDRTYGSDDEPEVQELWHEVSYSGRVAADDLALDYEVGPPHSRRGRIVCRRLVPAFTSD